MIGPVGRFLKRGTKHPLANAANEPRFLGERNELCGGNCAAARVLPADQRLEAGHVLTRGVDDRLVMNCELAALDRLTEIVFEDLTLGRLAVHRRLVQAVLATSSAL